MPKATRKETFDVDINKFYDAITDYENYPNFVDGCDEVEVLKKDEAGAKVTFSINVIKKFSYTLNLHHQRPNRMHWELDGGDLFKENKGEWELKDLGDGKTEVIYTLEPEFKLFVPKKIISKLVENNLPEMMQQFAKRAREL